MEHSQISDQKQSASGLSLLQGLSILAVLGIVASVVFHYLAA